MLTVILLLVVGAFVTTILAAMGLCPAWVPLILLCVVELLDHLPKG